MAQHRRLRRAPWAQVCLAGFTALAVLALGSVGTLSAWTQGALTNSADTTKTGYVSITHTYNGTSCSGAARTASVACGASLGTTASAPASTTDTISNSSTVGVTQSVAGLSCGVVRLANSNAAADPMLPRNGVTFAPSGGPSGVSGSGALSFGAGGYAAGVASQTLGGSPTGISLGTTYSYGYGVWFNTTASSGQLFGLGTQPTTTPSTGTTTFDRTLSLSGGKLSFMASGAAAATTSKTYNDGAWHFAYVSLTSQSVSVVLGVSTTTKVTIYVGGIQDGTSTNGGLLGSPLATPSGYWFLGGGGSSAYAGSLSNFAAYNGTSSPTSPPAAPYGAATELWPLNDTGYVTTTTATLPSLLQSACGKVNITLTFVSPAATVASEPLSTFGNGTATTVAAPASGTSQTLTIATSKGTSPAYVSDIAGLHLYVPIQFVYTPPGNTTWSQTLLWSNDPRDVFIA